MILATLGLLVVAALHGQSTEYVYSGPRLIAIERTGPPPGQIQGFKIDPYGGLFNSPGATITIDGVLSVTRRRAPTPRCTICTTIGRRCLE